VSKERKHTLYSDEEIITGIQSGDPGAMEDLYKIYYPMMVRLVINNGGDIDDAKDIFQETVIILHSKIVEGAFTLHSKLKTYLYSVGRNLWFKRLTKKGVYASIEDFEDKFSVEEDLEAHKERDRQFMLMESALNNLGEPCQTIIKDFYIHNMSMQDICEKFGYTNTDNAKNQKYKCLQRLKKLFFS